MAIWYILYSFGTFFPVLVSCTKNNLATLQWSLHPLRKKISSECRFALPCAFFHLSACEAINEAKNVEM
jgi:hypothetical protein